MTNQTIDQAKAEAFADKMMDVLNGGALALMVSVGHRTGLFDTMAGMPPSTTHQIAEASGLQERYVREWLGAMLTGGVVTYDPGAKTFALPPEHAAFLTRDSAPDNIAAFAQYIPLLGSVEDDIVKCFKSGGGVPYSSFPRFQDVMAEDSGQTVVPALMEHILPLIPDVMKRLEQGIEVLDVGCGSGRALNLMARHFPNSRFTGYDVSEKGIARAKAEAEKHGTKNVRFEMRDATDLGQADSYDFLTTFDAVHDQVHPDKVLAAIARVLRSDGTYLMQDIRASTEVHENVEHPAGTLLYTISCMHCMTVSLSGGGAGLGAMWGEQLTKQMLAEAGFQSIDVHKLDHDFQNNYYICRLG